MVSSLLPTAVEELANIVALAPKAHAIASADYSSDKGLAGIRSKCWLSRSVLADKDSLVTSTWQILAQAGVGF